MYYKYVLFVMAITLTLLTNPVISFADGSNGCTERPGSCGK
jgi:hypothetical protein